MLGMILFGLLLVILLTGAMWWDGRRRERLVAPKPGEQPVKPERATRVEEVREEEKGEDNFPQDGSRLLPYNMKPVSSHGTGEGRESRPRFGKNTHSGSFGSGGLGG
jgi:hypothetical protein